MKKVRTTLAFSFKHYLELFFISRVLDVSLRLDAVLYLQCWVWFLVVQIVSSELLDYKSIRSTGETAASQSNHNRGTLQDWQSGTEGGSKASYVLRTFVIHADALYYISKTRVYQCSVMSESLRNFDIYGV